MEWQPTTEDLLESCNITNLADKDCINSSAVTSLHTVYALGSILNNDQCIVDAMPFFCDATLLLCGEDEFVDLTSMCLKVRDNDCALEWREVETILNSPIPDCASFDVNRNLTFSKAPLPNCSDQFAIFCDSICLPLCAKYSPFSKEQDNTIYIFASIWLITCLIGGIVTLVACWFNRDKL